MPQKSKENTAPQNVAEIPHLKLIATVVQHFHLAMLAGRARVMASGDSPALERKTPRINGRQWGVLWDSSYRIDIPHSCCTCHVQNIPGRAGCAYWLAQNCIYSWLCGNGQDLRGEPKKPDVIFFICNSDHFFSSLSFSELAICVYSQYNFWQETRIPSLAQHLHNDPPTSHGQIAWDEWGMVIHPTRGTLLMDSWPSPYWCPSYPTFHHR